MPIDYIKIIGELFVQLDAANQEIDALHEQIAEHKMVRTQMTNCTRELLFDNERLQATIDGNPLAYAYACEWCIFETDSIDALQEHERYNHSDRADHNPDHTPPHGVERIVLDQV